MSQYSKVPSWHLALESLPYVGTYWHEAITTYPTYPYLFWSILFAVLSGGLHYFCYGLTKLFAPYLIGYTSTPPITKRMEPKQKYYVKLGEACKYTQMIDIERYNLNDLSTKYCDNQLSTKQIEKFLKNCNEHHVECAKQEQRFHESLVPVFIKSFSLVFGLYVTYDTDWLYDPSSFYTGWPDTILDEHKLDCCAADIKLLEVIQIGWYLWKMFSQVVLERHLKDFWAVMTHHVATIVLVTLSWTLGLMRVGIVVLLLHEPTDVVVHATKLCRLMGHTLLMNIGFVCLVVLWFVLRLVLFPYLCMRTTFMEYYNTGDRIVFGCFAWLCVLFVLHIHWFRVIIQVVIRAISGKTIKDVRSDSETSGEDADERES